MQDDSTILAAEPLLIPIPADTSPSFCHSFQHLLSTGPLELC